MPTAKLTGIVTRFSATDSASSAPDGELLARFIATHDEAAFAELVRRHGRLVFGVCRRVTGSHHLAEDAFQAVFVVLATRAAAIRPPAAVGAWLHGVACRTALRARTMADRRRRREITVPALPDATSPAAHEAPDAVALLDEEIARLPDHHRFPVVLCELEGVSRKDAARRLGIAEGTLSSRLAAARRALAERLRQRGVVLSATALSAAFAQTATASPPAALAARAAAALTPELVPAPVAALSNGVLRIMFLDKLRTMVLLLVISAGLAAGAVLAAGPSPPNTPSPRPPRPAPLALVATSEPVAGKVEAKPLPKGPNKILFYRAGHLTLIDPDGKNDRKVSEDRAKFQPSDARLSPDGKQLALLIRNAEDATAAVPKPIRRQLFVRGLDEKEPGTDLGVECQMFFWSPDGSEVACCDFIDGFDKQPEVSHFIVNVKTKEKSALKLPTDHMLTDWSRDGRFFVTTSVKLDKDRPKARLHLMNRDGTERQALTDEKTVAMFGQLSPNGKRVLFHRVEFPPKDKPGPPQRIMSMLDIATGKITKVEDVPLNAEVLSYCWSPDGKRIAYSWRERHEGKPEEQIEKETESFLVVCDPDGKNQKTIATEKGQGQWFITIAGVDWR